jgi:membrane dipeptidase
MTATLTAVGQSTKLQKKAARIHAAVLTVDTHADAPINMMKEGFDLGVEHRFEEDGSQIDLPRMKKGGMDAMFFAVYLGQGKRTPEANAEAKQKALAIFDKIHQAAKMHPDQAEMATTAQQAYRLEKAGKRAMFIGMENGWPVGTDLANLKEFYELGLRYITLSHSLNNDICDSSTDPDGPEHNGLSPFGYKVVEEMNRLGIMVDISHVSDATFFDVMRVSKAPAIASHSSCRALCDHPRNMTDEMIRALAKNGGVIQINFVPDFLRKPPHEQEISMKALRLQFMRDQLTDEERTVLQKEMKATKERYADQLPSVKDAVDHIDHVVRLVGINHVGIGMDLDGGGEVIGCRDVSEIGAITEELVRRGYSAKAIRKIWGGNIMRVLTEAEKVARTYK